MDVVIFPHGLSGPVNIMILGLLSLCTEYTVCTPESGKFRGMAGMMDDWNGMVGIMIRFNARSACRPTWALNDLLGTINHAILRKN